MTFESKGSVNGYWPVYKGESFDIWNPDTGTYYAWADPEPVLEWLQEKRLKAGRSRRPSPHREFPMEYLCDKSTLPCFAPRLVFRDVARATDARTIIACLIPPKVFVANQAPYILWPHGDEKDQAYLLGVLCSIPLDWYARRFIENHVSYFLFNPLPVPRPERGDSRWQRIVTLAGRLACPDERFTAWAEAVGVDCGLLEMDEKQNMVYELDALVAHLYGLDEHQLSHIFETFHKDKDYDERCDRVRRYFQTWQGR